MILRFVSFLIGFLFVIPQSKALPQAGSFDGGRPKIGLVLSGGGAKGLAHIGVLKVLEEAGIRPDYIGGTSMGSIVGGLYSIGYSADSLEKIAKSTNWNYLLGDQVSRRNLTIEEKEDNDRFFVSFPIKENKIMIPSGLVNGQNIEDYLNTLCAPVFNKPDFNDFPIPFLAVATDIETGKEVIFNRGYLPDVLRASMSIPSIFNPIEIDEKLLVDGGLVNNFPVARTLEMGADIIIGVDVGFRYYKKEELNSIFKILEQSVFFYGEALNSHNRSLCDVLIEPALGTYNASSFGSTDTIIALGEIAARKILPQLKALADSIYGEEKPGFATTAPPKLDSLQLMEIRIHGLERVSARLLTGKLQLEVLQKVTPKDISKAVERAYSSLYFDKISYTIGEVENGICLDIYVKETKGGFFKVGLHYDTNYRSAILLNTTFRNVLLNGSKLSGDLSLGENPFFQVSFFKNNGWKPGLGFNFSSGRLDAFVYEGGDPISSLIFSESKTRIFTQSVFSNSYAIGAGVEFESFTINPRIDPILGLEKTRGNYVNYYGFLNFDSYDNIYYPTSGIKLNTQFRVITINEYEPTFHLVARYTHAHSLHPRITFINRVYGGTV
ncbi:MAG: patatin-like phospholipase family protein, partial [Bacteroidales bacterium]|nr:patatin-like phospholipase family protein [Bacteroidales bacterium]